MADAKWDYNSPADMLKLTRQSLEEWRIAPRGRAAERKAARNLAFAVGRLDTLGAFAELDRKREVPCT